MQIDWPTIVAIVTVGIGLYTAISTRQHSTGEVFSAAMEVAKEALSIRDKDIERLTCESLESQRRIDSLIQYTEYLSGWVRLNYIGQEHPLSYEEYAKTTTK